LRVFITGASGFAGPYLVAACEAGGDTVIAAPPSSEANLADADVARRLIAEARPDVVYHLAARAHVGQSWADPAGTFAANIGIAANVFEAVRAEAPEATLVVAGSSEEYGPPTETLPMTEEHRLRPQNPYAASKASAGVLARFYADAYGLRIVYARPFNHSGPGQKPIYAIAAFAEQVARGHAAGENPIRVVTGSPDTRRDYTDVRDIVRGYRLLAEHGEPGEAYNICSGVSYSARELVAALGTIAGVAVDHVVDEAKVRANEVADVRGSAARLHAATGWQPEIPLEQTLRDTLESF
jgi:GDP-4-dehydro-6-deoxy-D-mannose reductase